MKKFVIPTLLVLGFIFRYIICKSVPEGILFDEWQYYGSAISIIRQGFFYVDTFRTYGYPLVLAALFRVIGSFDQGAAKMLNIVMDTATAYLVYLTAKNIIKKEKPSVIALFLYLFNPFTSPHVAIIATETTAIFVTGLIFYIFSLVLVKGKILYIALLAFTLGYLVQIKPGILGFSVLFLFILIRKIIAVITVISRKIPAVISVIILFTIPFLYNVIGNARQFHTFSALAADNVFVRELYISLFVDHDIPTETKPKGQYPPEVWQIYTEYSVPADGKGKNAMAKKYFDLSVTEIRKDPVKFLIWRAKKFFYIWEKNYFSFHQIASDKPYTGKPILNEVIYWSNIFFLVISGSGIILFRKTIGKFSTASGQFTIMAVIFIAYLSLSHMFTLADERFSLPAYPVLFMFAGYTIYKISNLLPRKLIKNRQIE
jgi:hypothetical protein